MNGEAMNKIALFFSILSVIFVIFLFILMFIKPLYFIIILIIIGALTVGFYIYNIIDELGKK